MSIEVPNVEITPQNTIMKDSDAGKNMYKHFHTTFGTSCDAIELQVDEIDNDKSTKDKVAVTSLSCVLAIFCDNSSCDLMLRNGTIRV